MYLCQVQKESQPYIDDFLKPFQRKTAYFSLFRGLCLATVSKCIRLFAITQVRTALGTPCVQVSAQPLPIAHWCLFVVEWQVQALGWVGSFWGEELLPWWCRAGNRHNMWWVGLWSRHACPNWINQYCSWRQTHRNAQPYCEDITLNLLAALFGAT